MIDSRDFIAAKRRAETEVMFPPGPKIALTGGLDFNDHHLIWDRLDKEWRLTPSSNARGDLRVNVSSPSFAVETRRVEIQVRANQIVAAICRPTLIANAVWYATSG